ncbi:exodeoxyribonuclease III [Sphingobium sp. PAMC28499]|uniref:exodeoxyribonuclease III n=1 Tax=Sphingobium sp. PAMC28499 TaxID=2565554 RepID=UPI0014450692|nr:exodeoxyribonuclease III [Sphingobium sp. PAMC28499]
MKIATYNLNGINGRLALLLRWLALAEPDVVCLQEFKASDERFPERAILDLGYEAIWLGQKSWHGVAILSRVGEIHDTRRGLPREPEDVQSRYIEAAVDGVLIVGLYLPNGNPRPGAKFDYKLRWSDWLHDHLSTVVALDPPVVVAGPFNVMPTISTSMYLIAGATMRCLPPEVREAYARLLELGWTDAFRDLHPDERIYTFGKYWRNSFEHNAGLRIDHDLLNDEAVTRLISAEVDRRTRGWGQDQRPCAGYHQIA